MPPPDPPPSPKFSTTPSRSALARAAPAIRSSADSPSSSTGLTHTMARIHSRKESDGAASSSASPSASTASPGSASSFLAKMGSSLPENRARTPEKPLPATREKIVDPLPGSLGAVLWFWFRFGRYANAVLPDISWKRVFAWTALSAAGLLYPALALVPKDPGPLSLFTSSFFLLQGGVLLIGGLVLPLLLAGILLLWTRLSGGRLPFDQALRIGLGALVPLASVSFALFLLGVIFAGESFWRGYLPQGVSLLERSILPCAVLWFFLRIAQAMVRNGTAAPLPVFASVLPAGGILALLSLLPAWSARLPVERIRALDQTLGEALAAYALDDTVGYLPALQREYDALPRRAVEPKARVLLLRLELHAAGGRIFEARADAERLRRSFPASTAWNPLARGLNLVLLERPDLGLPRLERALLMNPDFHPAHLWIARIRMDAQPATAVEHARRAWQAKADLLHLRVYVDALFRLQNHPEIWKTLAGVYQEPEQWFSLTLYQGGVAAAKTGNPIRARNLLRRARERDPALTQDLPASFFNEIPGSP